MGTGSRRTFDGRTEIRSSYMTGTASSPSPRQRSSAWPRQCSRARSDQINSPRSSKRRTSSPATNVWPAEIGTPRRYEMPGRRVCGSDSSTPSKRLPKAAVRSSSASPLRSMNGLTELPSSSVHRHVGASMLRPIGGGRTTSSQHQCAVSKRKLRDLFGGTQSDSECRWPPSVSAVADVPPQSSGARSAIAWVKVQRWPARSSTEYWRSP
jgi:hypothetical protein